MIICFSATGNSEFAAKRIAEKTGDTAVAIPKIIKAGNTSFSVEDGEVLGIVFPVYAWAAPKYVSDFVKNIRVEDGAYVYAVCTCGAEAGRTFDKLKKCIRLDACFSVAMPDNYIVMYDLADKKRRSEKIRKAIREIDSFIPDIAEKNKVDRVFKGSMSGIKSLIVNPVFNKFAADDSKFYTDDSCAGCGKCVDLCPLGNITLENGKPKWNGRCMQCLACIHRCPTSAIQYGKGTKDRGRYVFPFDEFCE